MSARYASDKPSMRAPSDGFMRHASAGKPTPRIPAVVLGVGISMLLAVVGCSAGSGSGPGNSQPGACTAGQTQCANGACANLQSDPNHCGSCGIACQPGQECRSGACGCVAPLTACASGCVNAQSDPLNCGTCGHACAAGLLCSLGTCSPTCAGTTTTCGAACVNVSTNPANCGACNAACATGQACSGGVCLGGASGAGGSPGTGGVTGGGGGATGTGNGLQVGSMCFPKCASAATDPTGTGYGFEAGRSCVVVGSAPALQAIPCNPPAAATGNGYLVTQMTGMMVCESSCKHPELVTDPQGYGYEAGLGCIVDGSTASLQNARCTVTVVPPTGNGYQVVNPAGVTGCIPSCKHPELADAMGYGFEVQLGCVVDGSLASVQNARCTLVPRTLPPPGNGFLLGQTCFPPCGAGAVLDGTGYGWDLLRACVVVASTPSIQGIPCVPPPATVTGLCPQVLQCPVVNGATIQCGCTWVVGLAARKQVIMATTGFSQYLLASAMLETADLTTNYPLGDNKTGDSFNAGIAKQNWGMIRRCHPAWNAMTAGQFSTSAAMNSSLALDVQVYNECRAMFGANWWSGDRAGFGSLGANTPDIQVFKGGMDWINMMLTTHLADDVRVWVTVPPI